MPRVADEIGREHGSELALSVLHLEPAASSTVTARGADVLLFGFEGSGAAGADEVEPGTALFVPEGETVDLAAGQSGLTLVRFEVAAGCDRHAPMGTPARVARVSDETDAASGMRSFQVLFGPQNGCDRATLFVGHVGPGGAPWHFHQYDEIVWIWSGEGRYHVGGGTDDFGSGSAFRVRPREVHIVENTGEALVLVGLFTPAGSPSAAYLAHPPR
jgi:mannose-6-phosphate isomerase-like protein (cupin superfamily)